MMFWSYVDEVADMVEPFHPTVTQVQDLKRWLDETEEDVGMVVTDKHSNIIMVNKVFMEVTGYQPTEVIGRNPRMLQSGKHNVEFYKLMWNSLLEKGRWNGRIWDRRKNREIYREWLNITVIEDKLGEPMYYIASFMISKIQANGAGN
ncbi:PAS domain-containing protein [Ammoniphilus sp. CFH 90114]|uniref:PAS domain S-box protein n=1 Tax=Ammoniphilus sp. CFH 90114 TaxID=2493665 RepID=UPI00100F74BC|nr:PAS domain-containing protein [Ammoniphilus sp. CFH 90114]RXT03639.1 PAS domain S-box protein [Ammoniphilus sp. CFH 90114]